MCLPHRGQKYSSQAVIAARPHLHFTTFWGGLYSSYRMGLDLMRARSESEGVLGRMFVKHIEASWLLDCSMRPGESVRAVLAGF
jgi:hypothetical protein